VARIPVLVTLVLLVSGPFRAAQTYAADVTRTRLAALVYVAAPGVLILVWSFTHSTFAYVAALLVALPLSLVANVASFVVAALVLPSVESNGAPIAAAFFSGAALLQVLAARAALRHHRGWHPRRVGATSCTRGTREGCRGDVRLLRRVPSDRRH